MPHDAVYFGCSDVHHRPTVNLSFIAAAKDIANGSEFVFHSTSDLLGLFVNRAGINNNIRNLRFYCCFYFVSIRCSVHIVYIDNYGNVALRCPDAFQHIKVHGRVAIHDGCLTFTAAKDVADMRTRLDVHGDGTASTIVTRIFCSVATAIEVVNDDWGAV